MWYARTPYAVGWIHASAPLTVNKPKVPASHQAFTKRNLLRIAFAYLDKAYGWGGENAGYDCSRLVMDVFLSMGLRLPRHSALQVKAAPFMYELPATLSAEQHMTALDAASSSGAVLLELPGHIMIYLGRDPRGTPMAIHAFTEYRTPCKGHKDKESRVLVNRVALSTLSLGEHSSTGTLLSRIRRVGVFGTQAIPSLERWQVPVEKRYSK